jgi:catechol 2,3-dioxygenase-like lactoylglutathione lyase family enzyme
MSFAVKAIDHVEVFVGDIAAAAKWYEDVLGLRELARWDPEPVMMGAGGTKR